MADESKTGSAGAFGTSAAVTTEFLDASAAAFNADPKNRLARNVLTEKPMKEVIIDRDCSVGQNHVFSNKIPVEGKATSQKSSGRCWLFAATNIMRLPMMKKYNLPNDFQFSQSYLFFHDKLEKSNYFLENAIDMADCDVDDRTFQRLLADPISDGGQWSMFASLINAYGIVPKSVYPENYTSSNSAVFRRFLVNQLRGFSCKLREMKAGGASLEELRTEKNNMMSIIHRVLLIHFGEPPKTFEWTFYDKEKKFQRFEGLTPKSFYEDMVPFDVNDYMSLVNDPRNEYSRLLTVNRLGNIVGGLPVAYVNVPSDKLREVARATIESGKPVWFGCDVGKRFSRKRGFMDIDQFDFQLTYGTEPSMTKQQRLLFHESLMTHAMVFTGFDAGSDGAIRKWRVENSWGEDKADKGYYVMTDKWFDQFMYQIVVEKSTCPDLVPVLEQEPVVLPAWDPMGSLACAEGDECCLHSSSARDPEARL